MEMLDFLFESLFFRRIKNADKAMPRAQRQLAPQIGESDCFFAPREREYGVASVRGDGGGGNFVAVRAPNMKAVIDVLQKPRIFRAERFARGAPLPRFESAIADHLGDVAAIERKLPPPNGEIFGFESVVGERVSLFSLRGEKRLDFFFDPLARDNAAVMRLAVAAAVAHNLLVAARKTRIERHHLGDGAIAAVFQRFFVCAHRGQNFFLFFRLLAFVRLDRRFLFSIRAITAPLRQMG